MLVRSGSRRRCASSADNHCLSMQLGKKPHAHSDYVGQHGPMVLYGLERDVDVMVRSTACLACLFCCRRHTQSPRQLLRFQMETTRVLMLSFARRSRRRRRSLPSCSTGASPPRMYDVKQSG